MFRVWMFIVLGFCITSTRPQSLDISRPTSGVDTFNIPPSMCSDPRIGCSSFSAAGPSCSCSCAGTHSTFTFVNNGWQCMANTGARNHFQRGCEAVTSFSGENADRRIPTLVIGSRREIALHYGNFQSIVTCSLNLRSSWFVGCNGSQRLLTNNRYNAAVVMFTISKRFASSRYILQVKTGVPNSSLLQGKVINLVMDCAARWFGTTVVNVESCLVFKLEGTESCPINRPTNSISSSTYVASSTTSRLETHSTIIQSSTSVPTVLVTSLHTSITPSTTSDTSSMIPKTSPTVSMWPRTSFVSTSRAPLSSPTASNITTIPVNSASVYEFTSRSLLSSPRTTESTPTVSEFSPSTPSSSASIAELTSRFPVSSPRATDTTSKVSDFSPSTPSSSASVSVFTSMVPLSSTAAADSTSTVSNFLPITYSSSPTTSVITMKTSSISSSFSSPTFSYSKPLSVTSLTASSVSPKTSFTSSPTVSSATPKASSSLAASSVPSSFGSPTFSYSTPLSVSSPTASSVLPKTAFISSLTVSNATLKASSSFLTASHITTRAIYAMFTQSTPFLRSSLTLISSPTTSESTPLPVTSMTASGVSPKTAFISSSTVSNATPKASSSLTTTSHKTVRASDSMLSQTTPFLRSWGTLISLTATFEAKLTASEVTPKASVLSATASEVTRKASVSSSTASDYTLRTSISSSRTHDATRRTSVSSSIVPDSTLIGFFSSSTVSNTMPRGSVSSPTAFGRRTTAEILPASSHVPPTVGVLLEVIEVSTTLTEAHETPFVFPPTEPGVQPTSFERNIPPTISGRRKGNINQLYVGLIAGIVTAVVALVIVVILLVCRRRYSRHTFRLRSSSEETKISVMMSPRTNSAYEPDEDDSDSNTLRRSSMYVPNYRIPLWEDETDNSRVYAVIHFPESTSKGATNGEEPFYHVLEGPDLEEKLTGDEENIQNDGLIRINGDVFQVIEDQSAEPGAYNNHIYAEVRRPKRQPAIKPKRPSEPLQEVLEPYIKGTEESVQQEAPCTENSIYFTLEKCFSDSFKGASNQQENKNAPACKVSEGPDQYKAICTEALVFCTKRSGSKRSNNNNETKLTIEQVFDDLEARYLKGTGDPGNSSTEKPGCSTQRYSLKEARDDSKRANESVYNFFEEVCRKGIPNYGAVSKEEGPVYFTLKRLKSNHSKATRIRPRCANESGSKKLDERFLKSTEENGDNVDSSIEKPVFFTLESCCSESLKRAKHDSTERNEPEGCFLEERYLKGEKESGQSASSGKPVFNTLETFCSNSFKKPNSESQC